MFLQVDARHLNIWVHTQHFNNLTTSALTRSSYAPVPFRRLPLSCLPVVAFLLPLHISMYQVSMCLWTYYILESIVHLYNMTYIFESILYFWKYTTSVPHDIFHTTRMLSHCGSVALSLTLFLSAFSLSLENILHLYSMTYSSLY